LAHRLAGLRHAENFKVLRDKTLDGWESPQVARQEELEFIRLMTHVSVARGDLFLHIAPEPDQQRLRDQHKQHQEGRKEQKDGPKRQDIYDSPHPLVHLGFEKSVDLARIVIDDMHQPPRALVLKISQV
jgi:hypothetical protein